MSRPDFRVEVVRGRLDEETSRRLIDFWTGQGALDEAAARERLHQVVCVLRDGDGDIAGVNSVYEAVAPLVGRPFWIYRRFIRPDVQHDAELAMIGAAYDALESEFGGEPGRPVGVCLIVTDAASIQAHPEAIWPEIDFAFAGWTGDDAQVRIRYFPGALI